MGTSQILAIEAESADQKEQGGIHRHASSHDAYLDRIRSVKLEGTHILLVEDSPDNQKLFHRVLTSAGALVDIASNGEIGVLMQREKSYDVIVMDIRMPILDGYQATRLIRNHGFQGPIIALTAHATPGEEDRCRASGCSHFLLKPIDRFGLLNAVDQAAQATLKSQG